MKAHRLLLLWIVCVTSLMITPISSSAVGAFGVGKRFGKARKNLSKHVKFAAGAVVGYGASRLTFVSLKRTVKVVGATYIVSEVLDRTGNFNVQGKFRRAASKQRMATIGLATGAFVGFILS